MACKRTLGPSAFDTPAQHEAAGQRADGCLTTLTASQLAHALPATAGTAAVPKGKRPGQRPARDGGSICVAQSHIPYALGVSETSGKPVNLQVSSLATVCGR
jgi:hypothetical protein